MTCPRQIDATMVFPADSKQISKFSDSQRFMVEETPELYEKVTREYINGIGRESTQWIRNIFDGKEEKERVQARFNVGKCEVIIAPSWNFNPNSTKPLISLLSFSGH